MRNVIDISKMPTFQGAKVETQPGSQMRMPLSTEFNMDRSSRSGKHFDTGRNAKDLTGMISELSNALDFLNSMSTSRQCSQITGKRPALHTRQTRENFLPIILVRKRVECN
jgi:hypothetical protein